MSLPTGRLGHFFIIVARNLRWSTQSPQSRPQSSLIIRTETEHIPYAYEPQPGTTSPDTTVAHRNSLMRSVSNPEWVRPYIRPSRTTSPTSPSSPVDSNPESRGLYYSFTRRTDDSAPHLSDCGTAHRVDRIRGSEVSSDNAYHGSSGEVSPGARYDILYHPELHTTPTIAISGHNPMRFRPPGPEWTVATDSLADSSNDRGNTDTVGDLPPVEEEDLKSDTQIIMVS